MSNPEQKAVDRYSEEIMSPRPEKKLHLPRKFRELLETDWEVPRRSQDLLPRNSNPADRKLAVTARITQSSTTNRETKKMKSIKHMRENVGSTLGPSDTKAGRGELSISELGVKQNSEAVICQAATQDTDTTRVDKESGFADEADDIRRSNILPTSKTTSPAEVLPRILGFTPINRPQQEPDVQFNDEVQAQRKQLHIAKTEKIMKRRKTGSTGVTAVAGSTPIYEDVHPESPADHRELALPSGDPIPHPRVLTSIPANLVRTADQTSLQANPRVRSPI